MESKSLIFQINNKPSVFQKNFVFREIFKYLIVFYTIFLSTYLLIDNVNKDNLNDYLKIAWIMFVMVVINLISFLMLNYNLVWIKSKYLIIFLILIFISYQSILVFLMDEFLPKEWINFYNALYYVVIPIIGLLSFWNLFIGFAERKIQPFLYKKNINNFMNNLLVITFLVLLDFFLRRHFILGGDKKININSYSDSAYLITLIFLFVFTFIYKGLILINFTKKKLTFNKDFSKYYLLSIIWVTPFTIWFSKDYQFDNFNEYSWFFLFIPVICILVSIIFSLLRNSELSSFKILKMVIAWAFLFVSVNKLYFEYYYKIYIDFDWTIIATIVAINILAFIVTSKSSNDSLNEAISFSSFIFICSNLIIVLWVFRQFNVSNDILNNLLSWNELVNMTLISSVVWLILKLSVSWWLTTMGINNFNAKETKINKKKIIKKNNLKEKNV